MTTDGNGDAGASNDAGAGQTQDAGQTTTTQTQQGGDSKDQGKQSFTQEEVNRFLAAERRKVRDELADYNDLKAKASKFDELEQARLSDIEKAQLASQQAAERAAAAEAALADERLRNAVVSAAVRAQAVDPEAVLALLDRKNLLDKQGQPQGVEDAVTLLMESKPYLKAQPSRPGGNIGQSGRSPDANGGSFTREQLRDTAFFEANKEAIFAAVKRGDIIE